MVGEHSHIKDKESKDANDCSERKNFDQKEIDEWIASFEKDEQFTVEKTYKDRAGEKTQRVASRDASGQYAGPYIRKEFSKELGKGNIYKRLWEAQRGGVCIQGISRILDYYEYADIMVCVLEYAQGETLEEYVLQNSLSLSDIEDIFAQICNTLASLHNTFDEPLLHRDIKPTNIIVSPNKVTIIDFGIARFHRPENTPDTTHLGTPTFAPPEQYGFGQTCIESDIYALGMVLYFMLTKNIAQCALRESSEFERECPECFKGVLLRATAFDPAKRYHTSSEFLEAFRKSIRSQKNCASKIRASKNHASKICAPKTNTSKNYTPKNESNDKTSAKRAALSAKFTELKHSHSKAWNTIILVFWAWLIACSVVMVFFPDEPHANSTLASRALECFGCADLFISTLAFLLFEKSNLREKHTWAHSLTLARQLVICGIALLFVSFFAWLSGVV